MCAVSNTAELEIVSASHETAAYRRPVDEVIAALAGAVTNFTLNTQLENGKPPSAEKARPTCKRYAYLTEKLSGGKLDDKAIRSVHQSVDAQASQAADTSRPPVRTLWHAFYYQIGRAHV